MHIFEKMKEILVLIPHYNNPEGLKNSIRSIAKEFVLVDVLIIDDGSKVVFDNEEIYNEFSSLNVKIINNAINRGIEYVLNDGLQYAIEKKYPYVARLDCGDLCLENRFALQQKFLLDNEEIAMVGSHARCVNELGEYIYTLRMPINDDVIRKKMFFNAMLIHPTIFFKSEIVEKLGGYPTEYKNAEDYAFFFKILPYYKFGNIDKELVQIELNETGISSVGRKTQIKNRIRLIKENFYFGYYPVVGILRSYLILWMPAGIIKKIKTFLFR